MDRDNKMSVNDEGETGRLGEWESASERASERARRERERAREFGVGTHSLLFF